MQTPRAGYEDTVLADMGAAQVGVDFAVEGGSTSLFKEEKSISPSERESMGADKKSVSLIDVWECRAKIEVSQTQTNYFRCRGIKRLRLTTGRPYIGGRRGPAAKKITTCGQRVMFHEIDALQLTLGCYRLSSERD